MLQIAKLAEFSLDLDCAYQTTQVITEHADDIHVAVPKPVGRASDDGGRAAMLFAALPGAPASIEDISSGNGWFSVGQLIAKIHSLPLAVIEDAGLPMFDGPVEPERHLSELDQAAITGLVPASLLDRWERALEAIDRRKFTPHVVHGDLSDQALVWNKDRPSGVLGWDRLQVADPATDFAWIAATGDLDAMDETYAGYCDSMGTSDPHVAFRARLDAELDLVRHVLHCKRQGDQETLDIAAHDLQRFAEDVDGEPL